MDLLRKIQELGDSKRISKEIAKIFSGFYESYRAAVLDNKDDFHTQIPLLNHLLDFVIDQYENPFHFECYHKKIVKPFDYYQFGMDFIRPLVKLDQSTLTGEERIAEIESALMRKENVILFSNHQTEPDPQAISLLLEKEHPALAQNMIFVAGHRVTTDPLAVPFSKGRNLLCIYSKNYIEHPPEKKLEKVHHNQKTMKKMRELLSEGGYCIYVAPSGGRDRRNPKGIIEVAPFDPQSIEMFWFTANHSSRPTHFYPLALSTFDLLPPPEGINITLGEKRHAKSSPIHLAFGQEIQMDKFPGSVNEDKKERRILRANFIWNIVNELYSSL